MPTMPTTSIEFPTDISFGTNATYAYDLYQEKKRQIAALEFECNLLIDKYHDEMCNANIPSQFRQDIISDMFGKDIDLIYKARNNFLKFVFSEEFLKKHKITFKEPVWQGYEHAGISIILDVVDADHYYSVDIPFPNNIKNDDTKKFLMGGVTFRTDRIHKSKLNSFVKVWEAVQMPTYDWKKCFEAIEKDVEKKGTENED